MFCIIIIIIIIIIATVLRALNPFPVVAPLQKQSLTR
jgi:branched-subunit amino acid transport protein AzlD